MTLEAIGKRVCVIGAGSSGITACRSLKARGIDFDCFEKGSHVGGLWRYENDNGMPGIYRSLFPNTSCRIMQFEAFPMPDDYPHYPPNRLVARYFDEFTDHFGLRDRIQFRTKVDSVSRNGDGWEVRLAGGDVRRYECVIVASGGHHLVANLVAFPGEFVGEVLHSSEYRSAERFAGKRVVVVGSGASAADIAAEVSRQAEETWIAVRTGAYFVPKFFKGQPTDRLSSPLISRLPIAVRRPIYARMLKTIQGELEDHGMPSPPYKLLQGPLTPNTDLFNAIGHGLVKPKPTIERLEGNGVRFADGSTAEVDAIVLATGYRINFPFLPEALVTEDESPELYLRVVHPDEPSLFFVGLLQPLGATMPLAEQQAEWIGEIIEGTVRVPSRVEMRKAVNRSRKADDRRYVDSAKGLFVEPYSYLRQLRKARKRGRREASVQAEGR